VYRCVAVALLTLGFALSGMTHALAQSSQTRSNRAAAAPAADTRQNGPVNRDILALYDGEKEASPAESRLHKWLEMPFNYLGYRVTYWDVSKGLPDAPPGRYRAIATWFDNTLPNAGPYLDWAAATIARGTKFIVLDSVGGDDESDLERINRFLTHLGIEFADYYVSDTSATTVAEKPAKWVGFEIGLDKIALAHQVVRTRGRAARQHLALSDPAHKYANADVSAVVTTSPNGGYVAAGFSTVFLKDLDAMRWVIDPIAFLSEALSDGLLPIPDTTTAMGRRIYFSHIDGDAWNGRSSVDGYREIGAFSADVVYAELIKPYPDLPVSVGLVSSDIDPRLGGEERAAEIARRMFALPQVEVASHTHTHPYHWSYFKQYSHEKELLRLIESHDIKADLSDRSVPALLKHLMGKSTPEGNALASAGSGAPRARAYEAFDLTKEVSGALATSTRLAPAGKTAKLYLWSGDTMPFEAAIRATREAGVRNMNGGDMRLDGKYPSLAYVPAITKPVGKERQVYAAASNENTYTNEWRGPFDGFSALHETVTNTDAPRRLKPFNIYYHMYSGSRSESLVSVKTNLELARRSVIIPIAASQYAAIADSFHGVSISQMGSKTWAVTNRGDINTFRFAGTDHAVDARNSIGVLGANVHAGSLYVALDPSVAEARIALVPSDATRRSVVGGEGHVVDSRWQISDLTIEPCRLSGRAAGFGAGETNWGGLRPGTYRLVLSSAGNGEVVIDELVVDRDGRLKATLGLDGLSGVRFALECSDPDMALEPAQDRTGSPSAVSKAALSTATSSRRLAAVRPEPNGPSAANKVPVRKRTATLSQNADDEPRKSQASDRNGEPGSANGVPGVDAPQRRQAAVAANPARTQNSNSGDRQAKAKRRLATADAKKAATNGPATPANFFTILEKNAKPQLLRQQ
jgi:hypothetical protein